MTVLNVSIAIGTISSVTVSWLRGGWVQKFLNTPRKLDSIEGKLDEVNEWRGDVDAILLGLSRENNRVDGEEVSDMLDVDFKYRQIMDENWKKKGDSSKIPDGGEINESKD